MFNSLSVTDIINQIPPLSNKAKKILQETTIDADYPGTILADWQTMLDLIGDKGIEVSNKQNYFSKKLLPEINQKLTHPVLIDLKYPIQKSYPYVHGLYLLLRTSGITKIIHQGSKTKLVIDPEILHSWQQLNPTEQYFILLEIWLFWASDNALEGYHHIPNLLKLGRNWELIPDKGVKITAKNETVYRLNYNEELVNLAVLNLLGIMDLQQGKPQAGKGWRITHLAKTPLGQALMETLIRYSFDDSLIFLYEESGEIIYGRLKPYLQEFFPEFQQQIIINPASKQEGIFVFKVSLRKAWRRISIPSDLSLEFLVYAILEAFDFDDDHLYQFICKNRLGMPFEINHPQLDEPPYTDEFEVGQLPLVVGDSMIFHFDFGDNWEFQVLLEVINASDSEQQEAKIIATHGTAPQQYGYEDEDY